MGRGGKGGGGVSSGGHCTGGGIPRASIAATLQLRYVITSFSRCWGVLKVMGKGCQVFIGAARPQGVRARGVLLHGRPHRIQGLLRPQPWRHICIHASASMHLTNDCQVVSSARGSSPWTWMPEEVHYWMGEEWEGGGVCSPATLMLKGQH